MRKDLFDISGMTCSACSTRIEKVVNKLEGVNSISVNLLKNCAYVDYDENVVTSDAICARVDKLGYPMKLHTEVAAAKKEKPVDTAALEMAEMKERLIISFLFTVPLFYVHMGRMYGWPLPAWILGDINEMTNALVQMLLCIPVLFVGKKYFIQVAFSVQNEKAYEREFRAFANLDNLSQKILISTDELDYSTSVVRHIKLKDFLLMEDLSIPSF